MALTISILFGSVRDGRLGIRFAKCLVTTGPMDGDLAVGLRIEDKDRGIISLQG